MWLVATGIPAPIGVCYPFWIILDVYQPLFPFIATRVLIGRIAVVRINGMAVVWQFIGGYLGNPFYAISPHFIPLTRP